TFRPPPNNFFTSLENHVMSLPSANFCVESDELRAQAVVSLRLKSETAPVPADEPVYLFRASNVAALAALDAARYVLYDIVVDPEVIHPLDAARADFKNFREQHPDRMRVPAIEV